MTVIVNDGLLSDLLNVETRALRAKGSRTNRYGGDTVRAGMKRR